MTRMESTIACLTPGHHARLHSCCAGKVAAATVPASCWRSSQLQLCQAHCNQLECLQVTPMQPPCCPCQWNCLGGTQRQPLGCRHSHTACVVAELPFTCSYAPCRQRCTTHFVPKGIEDGGARLQAGHDCSVQRARVKPAGAVGWRPPHLIPAVGVGGCGSAVGVMPAGRAPPDCGVVAVPRSPLDHHFAAARQGPAMSTEAGQQLLHGGALYTVLSFSGSHT